MSPYEVGMLVLGSSALLISLIMLVLKFQELLINRK